MKHLSVLLIYRLINGLFGILFFAILESRMSAGEGLYGLFSSGLAQLVLLTTLGGGFLSGLLVKNAYDLHSPYRKVIYLYTGALAFVLILGTLIFQQVNVLSSISLLAACLYVLTHLLSSVALVHDQLRQQFVRMGSTEALRMLIPLLVLLLSTQPLSVNQAILLLALGQVPGCLLAVYQALQKNIGNGDTQHYHSDRSVPTSAIPTTVPLGPYLRQHLAHDLRFGISFSSFNALAQWVIAQDRVFILQQPDAAQASNQAYTADQLTKISNGVLFPLNTKASSEVGALVRQQQHKQFYNQLNRYSGWTLLIGSAMTFLLFILVLLFTSTGSNSSNFLTEALAPVQPAAIIFYGLANTIYLACLIYQKRFDYTRYKALPVLLLLAAAGIGQLGMHWTTGISSYFFLVSVIYAILLGLSTRILTPSKLRLDR